MAVNEASLFDRLVGDRVARPRGMPAMKNATVPVGGVCASSGPAVASTKALKVFMVPGGEGTGAKPRRVFVRLDPGDHRPRVRVTVAGKLIPSNLAGVPK